MQKKAKIIIGVVGATVAVGAAVGGGVGLGLKSLNNNTIDILNNAKNLEISLQNEDNLKAQYTAMDMATFWSTNKQLLSVQDTNNNNFFGGVFYMITEVAEKENSDGKVLVVTITKARELTSNTKVTYTKEISGFLSREVGTTKLFDSIERANVDQSDFYATFSIKASAANKTANQITTDDVVANTTKTWKDIEITIDSVSAPTDTSVLVTYTIKRNIGNTSVTRGLTYTIANVVSRDEGVLNASADLVPELATAARLQAMDSRFTSRSASNVATSLKIQDVKTSSFTFKDLTKKGDSFVNDSGVAYAISKVVVPTDKDSHSVSLTVTKSYGTSSATYDLEVDTFYSQNEYELITTLNTNLAPLITINETLKKMAVAQLTNDNFLENATFRQPDNANGTVYALTGVDFAASDTRQGIAQVTLSATRGSAVLATSTQLQGFLTSAAFAKNVFEEIKTSAPEVRFKNNTKPFKFASAINNGDLEPAISAELSAKLGQANAGSDSELIRVSYLIDNTQDNATGKISATLTISLRNENGGVLDTYTKKTDLTGYTKTELDTQVIDYFVSKKTVPSVTSEAVKNKRPSQVQATDFNPINTTDTNENPRNSVSPITGKVTQVKSSNDKAGTVVAVVTISNSDSSVSKTYEVTVSDFASDKRNNERALEIFNSSNPNAVKYKSTSATAKIDTFPTTVTVNDLELGTLTTYQATVENQTTPITVTNKIQSIGNQNDNNGNLTVTVLSTAGTEGQDDYASEVFTYIIDGFNTTPRQTAKEAVEAIKRDLESNTDTTFFFTNADQKVDTTPSAAANVALYTVVNRDSSAVIIDTNNNSDVDWKVDEANGTLKATLKLRSIATDSTTQQPLYSTTVEISLSGFNTSARSANLQLVQQFVGNQTTFAAVKSDDGSSVVNTANPPVFNGVASIPFASDFNKTLTLSSAVIKENWQKVKTKYKTIETNSTEHEVNLEVTGWSPIEEVVNGETVSTKGEATVLATIGSGSNAASATYKFTIGGFPTNDKIRNQQLVDQYVSSATRAVPLLVNSALKSTTTASKLTNTDYSVNLRSATLLGSIDKVEKEKDGDGRRAVITVKVTAGSGASEAFNTYNYTDTGFLSENQFKIYEASSSLESQIEQAARANRLNAIANLIHARAGSQNKTADNVVANDIVIATENGVTFTVIIDERNSETGEVTIRLVGESEGESLASTKPLKVSLFASSKDAQVRNATKYGVDFKQNVNKNISANEATVDMFEMVAVSSEDEAKFIYTITAVTQVGTGVTATEGSVGLFTIKVALKSEPSVSHNYTTRYTNFIPTIKAANAKIVLDYIASSSKVTPEVAAGIKAAKSPSQLLSSDVTIGAHPSNLSVTVDRIDVVPSADDSANIVLKVSAGSGDAAYSATYDTILSGFAAPSKAANEITLERYIANSNRDEVTLNDDVDKNKVSVNRLVNDDFTLPLVSSVNQNITQRVTNVAVSPTNQTTAIVTVTLTLGSGERQATKTYTKDFTGFITTAKGQAFKVIEGYFAENNNDTSKYLQPQVLGQDKKVVKSNEISQSLALASPISDHWTINSSIAGSHTFADGSTADFSTLKFAVTKVEAARDELNAVDVTVTVTSDQGGSDGSASDTYVIRFSNLLSDSQYRNYQKAKQYADSSAKSIPQLLSTVSKGANAVVELTTASFTLTQPTDTDISLRITEIKPDSANDTIAVVTVAVTVGQGLAQVSHVTYDTKIDGFLKPGKALNEKLVKAYAESTTKNSPLLNRNINKDITSVETITTSNFSIAQPIVGANQTPITLAITSVAKDETNNKVTVTVTVTAGAGTDQATTTYTHEETGFASKEKANAQKAVTEYIGSSSRAVAQKSSTVTEDKTATEVKTSDFTLNPASPDTSLKLKVEISAVAPSPNDDTVVIVTIKVSSTEDSAVSQTYTQSISGFASAIKKENITKVKAYTSPGSGSATAPTVLGEKSNLSVSNLTSLDFSFATIQTQHPDLTFSIADIKEKNADKGSSQSEEDQKIAVVSVNVSTGTGVNFYSETKDFEISGFADRATGQAIAKILSYINSASRANVTLKDQQTLLTPPRSVNKEALTVASAPSSLGLTVSIDSIVLNEANVNVDDINSTVLFVKVKVADTANANLSRFYYSTISGFTSFARKQATDFATALIWPGVYSSTTTKESSTLLKAEEYKTRIPSEITLDHLSIAQANPLQTTTASFDRSKYEATFSQLNADNSNGSLTVTVSVHYKEGDKIGDFIATYNATITGFQTASQRKIANAVAYDFSISEELLKSYTASATNAGFYEIRGAQKTAKDNNVNDSTLVYSVTKVESQDDGSSVKLTISITTPEDPGVKREYNQTITGFLNKTKYDNLTKLNAFKASSNWQVGLSQEVQGGAGKTDTASGVANKINVALNDQNKLKTYFTNLDPNVAGLTRTVTKVEFDSANRTVTITYTTFSGTEGDDQISEVNTIKYDGFTSEAQNALVIARDTILAANKDADKSKHYIVIKDSSVNKIVDHTINTDYTETFFATTDFQLSDTLKSQLDAVKTSSSDSAPTEKVTATVKSVQPTTRDNLVNGQATVTIELKSTSSATLEFNMLIGEVSGKFKTFKDLIDEYIKKEDRVKPTTTLDKDQKWTTVAKVIEKPNNNGSNDTSNNIYSTEQNKDLEKGLKLSLNNTVLNNLDNSKIDFTYGVTVQLKTKFNNNSSVITVQGTYNEQLSGFKKNVWQGHSYRYQDASDNYYVASLSDIDNKEAVTKLEVAGSVTTINDDFKNNTSLTELTLNSGTTTISAKAFEKAKLTTLTLPSSMASIGESAFAASVLTSLTKMEDTAITSLKENVFAAANSTVVKQIHDWKYKKAEVVAVKINNKNKSDVKASEVQKTDIGFENSADLASKDDIHFVLDTDPISLTNDYFGGLTLKYKILIATTKDATATDSNSKSITLKVTGFKNDLYFNNDTAEIMKKVTHDFDAANLDQVVVNDNNLVSSFNSSKGSSQYVQTVDAFKPTYKHSDDTSDAHKTYRSWLAFGDTNETPTIENGKSSKNTSMSNSGVGDMVNGSSTFIAFKINSSTQIANLQALFSGGGTYFYPRYNSGGLAYSVAGSVEQTNGSGTQFGPQALRNNPILFGYFAATSGTTNANVDYNSQLNISNASNTSETIRLNNNQMSSELYIGQDVIMELYAPGTQALQLVFYVKMKYEDNKYARYSLVSTKIGITKSLLGIIGATADSLQGNIYQILNFQAANLTRDERWKVLRALGMKWIGLTNPATEGETTPAKPTQENLLKPELTKPPKSSNSWEHTGFNNYTWNQTFNEEKK
ncbi:gliding machinery surface structure protein Gli349 [Mycoplasmopsis agassizii]|uniref:gliding machinery surface structure protein Gli349 n=1 Tax=Mycoplasmopsis agassizii TaxID=33922 RepID=UPI0035284851